MKKNWILKPISCLFAALLAAGLFACGDSDPEQKKTDLVISEVVTSNGSSLVDGAYGSPDWIELHNTSSRPIRLFGYCVTDDIMDSEKGLTLPEVTIPANGYVVLYASKESATDLLSWDGGAITTGFSLKISGENLALLDDHMQLVQELTVPALERDVSYARRQDGSYGFCAVPTPNQPNETEVFASLDLAVASLNRMSTRPVNGIVFNEVSSRNVAVLPCSGCEQCDWVELRNLTSEPIELFGFTLTDEANEDPFGNIEAVLPANGYLVIRCCRNGCDNTDGHLCVELGISRYGEDLYLLDGFGNVVAEISVPELLEPEESYARTEDGTYGFCFAPTPNAENFAVADTQKRMQSVTVNGLIISEALPRNAYSLADRDGERCDWVELYNPTEQAISLDGFYLSDDAEDPEKWQFPNGYSVGAGEYLLVFLSGKKSNEQELHASFSLSAGEVITLYCKQTRTYDAITIPDVKDNVSVGRGADGEVVCYGQPTPLGPNGHARKEAESLGFFQTDAVFISEVCAIHKRGSDLKDWIELYNGGSERVDLSGWYLSDDADELNKWQLGDIKIAGGDYIVLETTSSRAHSTDSSGPFGISPSGETLYLSDSEGAVRDVFHSGIQRLGMSSGRIVNDNSVERVYFTTPTKGALNSSSYSKGYTNDPTFSETALYHTEPFDLVLSCLNQSATIYYTTDGSEPDTTSMVYSEPIGIKKNTVVRAVAVCDGLQNSEEITYHYLFEEPHTVPVVCIAMDADDFKTVNSVREHKDIKERKAYFNYYESDGRIGTSFPGDIKAKGQGTLVYAQKSFSIHLRGAYGQATVEYPFFEDYPYTEFAALVLRNGGQDYDDTRFIDSFVSRACLELNVEAANSRPCVVYINGAYHGLYDLNEDLNADYLATHYGADPDMVDLVRRNGGIATQGDKKEWKRVFNYAAKADLSSQAKYEEFLEWVDADYFIDYVIVQTFIANSDLFNQKYWRTQDYSIRWRPILYDLDFAFGSSTRNIMHNYWDYGGTPSHNGSLTYFYITCALRTNASFRQRFIERYVEVVCKHFNTERMTSLLDEMMEEYEPEMGRHIRRWGQIRSVDKWKSNCETLRIILERRPENILEQLRKEFGVSQSEIDALVAKYS